MKYKINDAPILQKPQQPAPEAAPAPQAAPQPPASSEVVITSSSNKQFGMADVPEELKNRQMTQAEVNAKLERGELMYGPVPQIPTLPAIDDITFDYCDGLRLMIPAVAQGQPKKEYYVHIVEHKLGVVIHSGIVKSDSFISTVQKFYTEFDLFIVKIADLPEDLVKKVETEYGVSHSEYLNILEMARYPEITTDMAYKDFFGKHSYIKAEDKKKYETAIDEIMRYINSNQKFVHRFDTTGKDVMVQLPVGTIGDSVGWFAYMERFEKKTKAHIICVMNPLISVLFEKQYSTITFITPKETVNYKPYACYRLGLFFKGDTTNQPYDFRYIGNHRTASKILDVNDDDIAPRADLSAPRLIQEPYVCIAVQASAYCKLWTNPGGWHDVILNLKNLGYRILCIDKEPVTGQGIVQNHIPWGVEDWTGPRPLQERIDILKDCDFFIGLSSGVSWLAWCAKCPVVMISGFTNPFNEFYTPYRVINTLFCHGCWNDERCDFDHYDYMWCPRHKGTEKAYECSKSISSKHVMNVIETIPAYQKRKQDVKDTKLAEDFNQHFDHLTANVGPEGESIKYCATGPLIGEIRMNLESGCSVEEVASRYIATTEQIQYIADHLQ